MSLGLGKAKVWQQRIKATYKVSADTIEAMDTRIAHFRSKLPKQTWRLPKTANVLKRGGSHTVWTNHLMTGIAGH